MKVFKIYFYIMLAAAVICSVAGKTLPGGILTTLFIIPYTIWIPVFIWAVMEVYKAFKK